MLIFSHFLVIFRKEVKELLNKQFILSLVFTVVFFGVLGNMMQRDMERKKETEAGLSDLDRTETSALFIEFLSPKENVDLPFGAIKLTEIIDAAGTEEALEISKTKNLKSLILIPSGFGEKLKNKEKAELKIYSIIKSFSIEDTLSNAQIESFLQSFNEFLIKKYLQKSLPDENIENILNPIELKNFVMVKGRVIEGNPAMVTSLITSQGVIIPIILMMVIIYCGTILINSMALEKENKTLETLLTLPIKRTSIIIGKISAAAVVGFLSTAVYMAGFSYYMQPLVPESGAIEAVSLETLGLKMGVLEYFILGISLFLTILIALSSAMLLGIFSEDTKNAQTMIMPLILFAVVPLFILMFQDIETMSIPMKAILYAIPFSHPVLAARDLLFGDFKLPIFGIIYLSIFLAATLFIILKIFNTDKILTAKFSFRRKK